MGLHIGLRIGLQSGALAVLLASANLAVAQSEVADAAMQRNNAEVRRLVQDGADVNLRKPTGPRRCIGRPTTAMRAWPCCCSRPAPTLRPQIVKVRLRCGSRRARATRP